ncbi:hypothetical protein QOT17_023393 [Balamuthia mandrillaris]
MSAGSSSSLGSTAGAEECSFKPAWVAGQVVWAKFGTDPYWPAYVLDECEVDMERLGIPPPTSPNSVLTHFFGEDKTGWVRELHIMPFHDPRLPMLPKIFVKRNPGRGSFSKRQPKAYQLFIRATHAAYAAYETQLENLDIKSWKDTCWKCRGGGEIICCDLCPAEYCFSCVGAGPGQAFPNNWYCARCTAVVRAMLKEYMEMIAKQDTDRLLSQTCQQKDYKDYVTNPINYKSIKQMLRVNEYRNIPLFEHHFKMACTNAMFYHTRSPDGKAEVKHRIANLLDFGVRKLLEMNLFLQRKASLLSPYGGSTLFDKALLQPPDTDASPQEDSEGRRALKKSSNGKRSSSPEKRSKSKLKSLRTPKRKRETLLRAKEEKECKEEVERLEKNQDDFELSELEAGAAIQRNAKKRLRLKSQRKASLITNAAPKSVPATTEPSSTTATAPTIAVTGATTTTAAAAGTTTRTTAASTTEGSLAMPVPTAPTVPVAPTRKRKLFYEAPPSLSPLTSGQKTSIDNSSPISLSSEKPQSSPPSDSSTSSPTVERSSQSSNPIANPPITDTSKILQSATAASLTRDEASSAPTDEKEAHVCPTSPASSITINNTPTTSKQTETETEKETETERIITQMAEPERPLSTSTQPFYCTDEAKPATQPSAQQMSAIQQDLVLDYRKPPLPRSPQPVADTQLPDKLPPTLQAQPPQQLSVSTDNMVSEESADKEGTTNATNTKPSSARKAQLIVESQKRLKEGKRRWLQQLQEVQAVVQKKLPIDPIPSSSMVQFPAPPSPTQTAQLPVALAPSPPPSLPSSSISTSTSPSSSSPSSSSVDSLSSSTLSNSSAASLDLFCQSPPLSSLLSQPPPSLSASSSASSPSLSFSSSSFSSSTTSSPSSASSSASSSAAAATAVPSAGLCSSTLVSSTTEVPPQVSSSPPLYSSSSMQPLVTMWNSKAQDNKPSPAPTKYRFSSHRFSSPRHSASLGSQSHFQQITAGFQPTTAHRQKLARGIATPTQMLSGGVSARATPTPTHVASSSEHSYHRQQGDDSGNGHFPPEHAKDLSYLQSEAAKSAEILQLKEENINLRVTNVELEEMLKLVRANYDKLCSTIMQGSSGFEKELLLQKEQENATLRAMLAMERNKEVNALVNEKLLAQKNAEVHYYRTLLDRLVHSLNMAGARITFARSHHMPIPSPASPIVLDDEEAQTKQNTASSERPHTPPATSSSSSSSPPPPPPSSSSSAQTQSYIHPSNVRPQNHSHAPSQSLVQATKALHPQVRSHVQSPPCVQISKAQPHQSSARPAPPLPNHYSLARSHSLSTTNNTTTTTTAGIPNTTRSSLKFVPHQIYHPVYLPQ